MPKPKRRKSLTGYVSPITFTTKDKNFFPAIFCKVVDKQEYIKVRITLEEE